MLAAWCLLACCFQGPTVTYVANEGVLIAAGEDAVLIDAIHQEGNPIYAKVAAETFAAMRAGADPYDQVTLVLVTHPHPDHFHAQAIADHLRANSGAVFIAPPDAAQAVGNAFPGAMRGRVRPLYPGHGESLETRLGDVAVRVLNLPHGSKQFAEIQNVGYVLNVGGYSILHVGDAKADISVFEAYSAHIQGVDIAIFPYWYMMQTQGRDLIDTIIKPGQLLLCHVPPAEADEVKQKVQNQYPQAIVLVEPGQQISMHKAGQTP